MAVNVIGRPAFTGLGFATKTVRVWAGPPVGPAELGAGAGRGVSVGFGVGRAWVSVSAMDWASAWVSGWVSVSELEPAM